MINEPKGLIMFFNLMIFKFEIFNNRKFNIYALFLASFSNCLFRSYRFALCALCRFLICIRGVPWTLESLHPIPFALRYEELRRS
jgi:hypothetical protein